MGASEQFNELEALASKHVKELLLLCRPNVYIEEDFDSPGLDQVRFKSYTDAVLWMQKRVRELGAQDNELVKQLQSIIHQMFGTFEQIRSESVQVAQAWTAFRAVAQAFAEHRAVAAIEAAAVPEAEEAPESPPEPEEVPEPPPDDDLAAPPQDAPAKPRFTAAEEDDDDPDEDDADD